MVGRPAVKRDYFGGNFDPKCSLALKHSQQLTRRARGSPETGGANAAPPCYSALLGNGIELKCTPTMHTELHSPEVLRKATE